MRSFSFHEYCIEPLESRTLLAAQLVADLDPRTISSSPAGKLELGTQALFWVKNDLWRTDGTAGGTAVVRAGFGSANNGSWTVYHGQAYFFAKETSSSSLYSFWKSDGTPSGTVKIADISGNSPQVVNDSLYWGQFIPGKASSQIWKSDGTPENTAAIYQFNGFSQPPSGFTYYKSYIYFAAADTQDNREVWRTDGTSAGTALFKEIYSGTTGSGPTEFEVSNNLLYFIAATPTSNYEPWVSDGTAAGTTMLSEIKNGTTSSFPGSFTEFKNATYFIVIDGIYKTNGTTAGTTRLMTSDFKPTSLTVVENQMFFSASNTAGTELWHSDGTPGGTNMVKNIHPDAGASSTPEDFVAIGSELYFSAADAPDANGNRDWWKSDGTANGTVKVADFRFISSAIRFGTKSFFTGDDSLHGSEPYISDGTPAGTYLLSDINKEPLDSNPGGPYPSSTVVDQRGRVDSATIGDTVYFTTTDGSLYKSDGTTAGTTLIKKFDVFDLRYMAAWNGSIYFLVATTSSAQVWRSDGTPNGTVPLVTGSSLDNATLGKFFVPFGGALYFLYPTALYKTDGTSQGTSLIASGFSRGDALTASGNHLFFINGTIRELWMSDGTTAGTTKMSTVVPAMSGIGADAIYDFNGVLYFRGGSTSTIVHGLWKTDGTVDGTAEIKPGIMTTTINGPPYEGTYFVAFKNQLWFAATSSGAGWELWSSDGTTAGTAQVMDINPGAASSWPSWLTVADGRLFFAAKNTTAGFELWSTDGTAVGTALAADVHAGSSDGFTGFSSNFNEWQIYTVGATAFFIADDGATGRELWQSQGTPDTTVQVTDLYPGVTNSLPRPMGAIHPGDDPEHLALIFSAKDPVYGRELWRTPSDNIPPVVSKANFAWDVTTVPRTVTLQFNEPLASFSSNDVAIIRDSDQQPMPFTFDYNSATNVATLTLATAPSDDNYRVTIPAGRLRDLANNVQPAAVSYDFFVLSADGNRDRTVDIQDFNLLAVNFGKTGQTFSQGNYDFSPDGSINIFDFNVLATHFGNHLDPATSQVQSAASSEPVRTFSISESAHPTAPDDWHKRNSLLTDEVGLT